jgi:hypothetical protein
MLLCVYQGQGLVLAPTFVGLSAPFPFELLPEQK